MRKSYAWLIISAILLFTIGVGVTVALLVSSSNTVVNTFTVGSIDISLRETTGDTYVMAPGVDIPKDPAVTVIANSESCWLFVKVEKENGFDRFCDYETADGWSSLGGYEGIFYRAVEKSGHAQVFSVLKNNCIQINENVTEEQLNALTSYPTLDFTAYAIQSDGFDNAHDAWEALDQ